MGSPGPLNILRQSSDLALEVHLKLQKSPDVTCQLRLSYAPALDMCFVFALSEDLQLKQPEPE